MIPVPTRRLVSWSVALALASLAVLVVPTAVLVLIAVDLLLAGLALMDWLLTPGPAVLEVTRLAPGRMSVLSEQRVGLLVRNRFRLSLHVRLRDTAPEALVTDVEEVAGTAPGQKEFRLEYAVRPMQRGLFHWGAIHLRYRSLLGLWEKGKTIGAPAAVHIYPNLSALQRYQLLAQANRLEALGIRKARQRGSSWEFESLRDYTHGDDTRLIDWKATARRRKPIVRNQEAERNQTILILVDCGRLMNAEVEGLAKVDYAVNTALLLSHVALSRGDRVGLCTFSHKVHAWVPPRPHVAQNRLITEALYDLRGDFTESDHGRCLRLVRARHPKRALLVLLTDFVDADTAADMIAHLQLAGRRHLILFVALGDPFLNRAARLRPAGTFEGFRKAAAVELLRDRKEVLGRLRQMGAHVLDAEPAEVTPPLINRYLEITLRGQL
jgi:uncharacterized protein (DUF58 family)